MTIHIDRSATEPMEKQYGEAAENCVLLDLEGMSCASCAMRIERGLKKVPGVKDASVNLATERATVTYDAQQTDVEQMVKKVEAVGYKASPVASPAMPESRNEPKEQIEHADGAAIAATAQAQVEQQSKRRREEIAHKRNLLLLGIALTIPIAM